VKMGMGEEYQTKFGFPNFTPLHGGGWGGTHHGGDPPWWGLGGDPAIGGRGDLPLGERGGGPVIYFCSTFPRRHTTSVWRTFADCLPGGSKGNRRKTLSSGFPGRQRRTFSECSSFAFLEVWQANNERLANLRRVLSKIISFLMYGTCTCPKTSEILCSLLLQ
jgi:hypothetical protein